MGTHAALDVGRSANLVFNLFLAPMGETTAVRRHACGPRPQCRLIHLFALARRIVAQHRDSLRCTSPRSLPLPCRRRNSTTPHPFPDPRHRCPRKNPAASSACWSPTGRRSRSASSARPPKIPVVVGGKLKTPDAKISFATLFYLARGGALLAPQLAVVDGPAPVLKRKIAQPHGAGSGGRPIACGAPRRGQTVGAPWPWGWA